MVGLVPDKLVMVEESEDRRIYTITAWTFDYVNKSNPNSGIVVEIHLKRKIVSEMMTTYFPTTLLVLITAATTQSWKKSETLGIRFPNLIEFFLSQVVFDQMK